VSEDRVRTKQDIADSIFGTGVIPLNQPDTIDLPLSWWEDLERTLKQYEYQVLNYSYLKDFFKLAREESIQDYFLDEVGKYLVGPEYYNSSYRNDVYHFLYNPKTIIQYKDTGYVNPYYKLGDGFEANIKNVDLPALNEFICEFFSNNLKYGV
jgi:hypothetical protein